MKSVMAVLRAKQKEVEEIEAQLAKMLDELKASTFLLVVKLKTKILV